jgi:hypothetical protein
VIRVHSSSSFRTLGLDDRSCTSRAPRPASSKMVQKSEQRPSDGRHRWTAADATAFPPAHTKSRESSVRTSSHLETSTWAVTKAPRPAPPLSQSAASPLWSLSATQCASGSRLAKHLQAVLLTAAQDWAFAVLHSRVTELPGMRSELRRALGSSGHPHILLRFGQAADAPTTPRRPATDVIDLHGPTPA